MADLSSLTSEEKALVSSLVRSPGWATLVKYVIFPRLQHASAQVDTPGADLATTQFWRGTKMELRHLLQVCYSCAGLPDPFQEQKLALLLTLHIPGSDTVSLSSEPPQKDAPLGDGRLRRPAYPVL